MTRPLLLGLLVSIAALFVAGCGGSSSEHGTSGARRTLTDLTAISQLQSAFNKASGEPRLILIVSPT
jgi:hypothetical protein